MKRIFLVGLIGLFLAGCGKEVPPECDGATITQKEYTIMGSNNPVYKKNNNSFEKIIDQELTKIYGETKFQTISYETPVIEECILGDYSFVKAVNENKVAVYSTWVKTSILDKGQILEDPYIRTIDSFVTSFQYKPDDFEELKDLLGSDFDKVNKLRYLAAKTVVDNGKCDYVVDSNIDVMNMGTKDNLRFVVECKNKTRIPVDENTINNGGVIKTLLEQAIPQNIAIEKCNDLIKGKANKYGEVDLYSLTGTSYDVNKTNGNATVDVYFDVKNKLGITEKFKARCLFESGSWNEEIVISNR